MTHPEKEFLKADLWAPVEQAYGFEADIPDSRLIIFDGVRHIPLEEFGNSRKSDDSIGKVRANSIEHRSPNLDLAISGQIIVDRENLNNYIKITDL